MVHLLTVSTAFQARVLAARLGSEGILTQLRGAVGGPYPVGDVLVYVDEDEIDLARQLLLADEVEAAFEPSETNRVPTSGRHWATLQLWLAAGAVVLVAAVSTVARIF